ncbi:hypothetical protein JZ751_026124 [Albula glossodonta]|uniref:Dynactin subunit 5 n=1 Tax=Albula glossodonta TaxID=121402 RepID=A0A8T2PF01_9TELE|nr:hypothetical protein JZ751_026124 [Albula glossodonta]
MELCEILYNKAEYIETASGNKVSRQSVLCGSQNIVLNGKTIVMNDCIIRGDLANVRVGRQCVIKSRSVIRPPFKKFSKGGSRAVQRVVNKCVRGERRVLTCPGLAQLIPEDCREPGRQEGHRISLLSAFH